MNPIAVALQRATAAASDRASLLQIFEKEFESLQYSPEAESIVLGVPIKPAQQWAKGELSDLDLILSIRKGDCGAVWWATLPRIEEFSKGIETARKLFLDGAEIVIAHTQHPLVRKRFERFGGSVTHQDGECSRLMLPRDGFERWMSRLV